MVFVVVFLAAAVGVVAAVVGVAVSQSAFFQDLFHFLRFSRFFSRCPDLFKNILASVEL